ncbi:chromosome segregation protein SMC [Candidatus Njordibacter sp. Uisw_058]|uniref:chromosome segregation protein SMC n=1 Tax=Candidatus Njordibacter sp. Uisw_058 TaxID=3230974 RepID=UPI003D3CDBC0
MRLKSIKLAGFKSFVDPTKVLLPGNLCAVVGPNGCGKSNIIDAVRWVMGESSAKNLRGENATDVIFNGSSSRQPVGQATIELVFDNHDRTLAGEFASYNEVSIRRKVTREGQSTYYLNGQKCRRRDVTDLFLGTGLGPRSYSIIEQGMISRLIESRPEELRVYIEEAAGISRYKERRRDTANRISRSRENLARLQDIREELGRQLETLKQQATAAEQYTELKQNERQHKSQLAALQWRELRQKLIDQRINMGRIEEQIVLQKSEQDTRLVQMDVQKNDLALLNDSFTEQQGGFYGLGADIARLEQTIEYQQQQQKRWQADETEALEQLQRIDEACTADGNELNQLSQQQEQLELDAELASEQLFEAETHVQEKEEERQYWQLQWQQKSDQTSHLKRIIEVAKTGLQHQQQQASQARQDRQTSASELENLSFANEDDIDLLGAQLDQQKQQQQLFKEQLLNLETELEALKQEERGQQEALDGQVQELGMLAGQLASLRLLLAEAEREAPDLPADWQAEVDQKLVDTMQVDPQWEVAVEHVLQDWLGGYLLGQMPDQNVDQLIAARGLTLFVPQQHQNSTKPINAHPSLVDKVTVPFGLQGLLAHVFLANNWHEANDLLASLPIYASVILPDGLWIGHGWVRTPPREGSVTGVLGRKQQVQALSTQEAALRAHQKITQDTLTQAREETVELEKTLTQTREAQQQGQHQAQQKQQALALLQQQSQQGLAQQQNLQQRIQQQTQRLEDSDEEIALLQEQLGEHELALESTQLNLPDLEVDKESVETQLGQVRLEFSQKQQQVMQLQARKDSVLAQITSLGRSVERLHEQRAQWRDKQTEIESRVGSQQQLDDGSEKSLAEQLERLLTLRVEAETKMEQGRRGINQLEQVMRQLEKQQLQQDNEIQQADRVLQDERLIERELEVNAEHIKKLMIEQNVLVEKLAEILPETIDQEQLSRLLEQCQNRIKRLGAINLVAIEEYKLQQERKAFLDLQHDEVIDALDSLEQAMQKIDKETRARFKQTFDTVNESLGSLFPKVFGGGRASLELTDDDMLSTGVTIMAQPPGKRNSSIHLLSGGEKALTAIALVFSIFQLNPSPFCMLDEVDAPLDDANVERYARLVKEMSAQVQFIYISHNKIAMEMATQLLGVTMQEAGVSRVVTVDVDQAINMTDQTLAV